jgi:radical SAM protein with 4Fe4S-binding SPASM domain
MDIRNDYLRLGEEIRGLHVTPEGGWMLGGTRSEIDFSRLMPDAAKSIVKVCPIFPVNRTAMQFIRLCDGQRTGGQICKELALANSVTEEAVFEAVSAFVSRAIALKHLNTEASPVLTDIQVSGNERFHIPVHASIEVTTRCNFRCSYCYRAAEYAQELAKKDMMLSREQFCHVLDELHRAGLTVVELTGGEALLHPDIAEIIRYCGTRFALCALLTNGSLISEPVAEALADAGNFFVSVSLDGPNAEVVDAISQCPGSFDRIIRGLQLLKKHKVHFGTAMTVTPENFEHMEATLQLSAELSGGGGFSASTTMTEGRARNTPMAKEFACQFQRRMAELHEKYPNGMIEISKGGVSQAKTEANCGAGWRSMTISPAGNVRACLINTQSWSCLGNVLETPVDQIFDSEKARFFRQAKWPTAEVCGDCEHFWYCGNCIMRGVDSYLRRDPNCKWAKVYGADRWVQPGEPCEPSSTCVKVQAAR